MQKFRAVNRRDSAWIIGRCISRRIRSDYCPWRYAIPGRKPAAWFASGCRPQRAFFAAAAGLSSFDRSFDRDLSVRVRWLPAQKYAEEAVQQYTLWLLVLFGAQILLGFVNLILLAPVWMQLIHLLVADLVWIRFVLLADLFLSGRLTAQDLAHAPVQEAVQ